MMLAFSPWTVFHALVSSQPIMQLKVQNETSCRSPSYSVGSFQLVSHPDLDLDLDLDLVLVLVLVLVLPLGKAVLCVLLLSLAFAMMLVVCLPGCKLIAMLIAPMC